MSVPKIWSLSLLVNDTIFRGDFTSERAAMEWVWAMMLHAIRTTRIYNGRMQVTLIETKYDAVHEGP